MWFHSLVPKHHLDQSERWKTIIRHLNSTNLTNTFDEVINSSFFDLNHFFIYSIVFDEVIFVVLSNPLEMPSFSFNSTQKLQLKQICCCFVWYLSLFQLHKKYVLNVLTQTKFLYWYQFKQYSFRLKFPNHILLRL